QTVVGIWPVDPDDAAAPASLVDRVCEYMRKAVREAKQHTSWINVDQAYEDALEQFVRRILEDGDDNPFVADLRRFVAGIVRPGIQNALAQLVLKVTSPGVPDFYQGTELWDLSLVDPDNRRPVDYARRSAMREELQLGG